MIKDVKEKLETITSGNGFAVFPRAVVEVQSPNELPVLSVRTLAIQSTQGGCGIHIVVPPGGEVTEAALRQNAVQVLSSDYAVNPQKQGQPLVVGNTDADILSSPLLVQDEPAAEPALDDTEVVNDDDDSSPEETLPGCC